MQNYHFFPDKAQCMRYFLKETIMLAYKSVHVHGGVDDFGGVDRCV